MKMSRLVLVYAWFAGWVAEYCLMPPWRLYHYCFVGGGCPKCCFHLIGSFAVVGSCFLASLDACVGTLGQCDCLGAQSWNNAHRRWFQLLVLGGEFWRLLIEFGDHWILLGHWGSRDCSCLRIRYLQGRFCRKFVTSISHGSLIVRK